MFLLGAGILMGAIERGGYRFEPEYSVIEQNGAIHVYHEGNFVEELKFAFSGDSPDLGKIEELVEIYCEKKVSKIVLPIKAKKQLHLFEAAFFGLMVCNTTVF